jgi:hypothetical protein
VIQRGGSACIIAIQVVQFLDKLWIIPELGTTLNYNLPSFPNIWEDTIRLVKDIEELWNEIQHTS